MAAASLGLGVHFTEGGKPENQEVNPGSTRETNYNNSTRMNPKFFENQHGAIPQPGLTGNSVVKGNALTAIRIPYKMYTNAVCTL